MSNPRSVLVVGLSHRTAPVEVRESLAFDRDRLPAALNELRAAGGVEEAAILSTCNRVEVYLCAHGTRGEEHTKRFLAAFHGLALDSFESLLYRHEDIDAVIHLFRVVSGLDSMVVGEAQITGQVKDAYAAASREGAVGSVLHRLFQQSLAVAKRARSCSDIGQGRASVGSVAVQLAERIFETLAERTALLVGAGKMGEAVLRSLRSAGAQTTLVANRTFAKAEALAGECGGDAVRFDRLADNLARADIVISSTDAPHYVIRPPAVARALDRRRGRPVFLIDIAVPRNIDPAIAEIEGAFLYNMDDLQSVVAETMARRRQEVNRCMAIVDEEAYQFMRWAQRLHIGPTVADLREKMHELKRREVAALLNRLPDLSEENRRVVERMADRLVNKILHHPIKALRESNTPEHQKGAVAAVRRLFGLSETASESSPESRELAGGDRQ